MIASNGCSLASATDFILQWPLILSRYHKDTGKFSPACRVPAADHSSGNHTAFKWQSGSLKFKPWCWLDENKIWSPQISQHHRSIRNIDDKIHDTEGQILVHYEILNYPVEGKTVQSHKTYGPATSYISFLRQWGKMHCPTVANECSTLLATVCRFPLYYFIMMGFIC